MSEEQPFNYNTITNTFVSFAKLFVLGFLIWALSSKAVILFGAIKEQAFMTNCLTDIANRNTESCVFSNGKQTLKFSIYKEHDEK